MLKSIADFKPTLAFNFSRLRLSSTRFLNAGHVAKGEASDRMERESSRVDRVSLRSTRSHEDTCILRSVITTEI